MTRTAFAAGVCACAVATCVQAATLTGLNWTVAHDKPALRMTISGTVHPVVHVLHKGRLLRINLRHTTMGPKIADLPALATVKGVYPYLADHGHGIDVDVLLTHKARLTLARVAGGYLATLQGVPVTVAAPRRPVVAAPKTPNLLTKITFSTFPGDRIELHLTTLRPPPVPSAFVLTKPSMVVLDLADTRLALPKDVIHIGEGAVEKVTAVESNDITRLVVRLVNSVSYRTYLRPHAIDVMIASPNTRISQATAIAPTTSVLPTFARVGHYRIRAISFRRGRDGAAKVAVRLSSSAVAVSVHNRSHRILVDFHDTFAPERLQRRLVVTDFATPVNTIKTFVAHRMTRMVLSAAGHYTETGFQSGRVFILRVTPLSRAAFKALERRRNRFASRKISLNFQHISVRGALRILANFTGLNFITSNAVTGNLTLHLTNVPWKQALSLILTTKGLAMKRTGNIVLIAPAATLAAQEQAHLKAEAAARKLEPLETVLIRMNYAKARDIARVLKSTRTLGTPSQTSPFSNVTYSKATTESTSLLSARGQVTVDPRTNSLIIQDTPQRIRAIRKLIAKLDRPVRQVLIEARLVEANNGFNKNLGAQLGLNYSYSTPSTALSTCPAATCGPESGSGGGAISPYTLPTQTTTGLNEGLFNVNLPAAGVGQTLPATFALSIAKLASGNLLNLELSALQAENKGKIISSPRLITANDRRADIKQGQEQFFNLGFGQSTMQQAVLGLSVTPQITPDNRIIMSVDITDNSFANAVAGTLDEKSLKTQVLVNNGQTVVIGGIYQTNRLTTVTKVPLLGNLPLLGDLFRNTTIANTRTELLIFLTPRILAPSLSLRSG